MRKILIIALGLASFAALAGVQPASAAGQTCAPVNCRWVQIHDPRLGTNSPVFRSVCDQSCTPNYQGPGTSATQSINQLKNQKKF